MRKQTRTRIEYVINECNFGFVKDGKTVDYHLDEYTIPTIEEFFNRIVKNINDNEFTITRVSPQKANCIIRIFYDKNITDGDEQYWIYGAEVFTKSLRGMFSAERVPINYSKHQLKFWFCQDEYMIVQPHFVDYYVLIV